MLEGLRAQSITVLEGHECGPGGNTLGGGAAGKDTSARAQPAERRSRLFHEGPEATETWQTMESLREVGQDTLFSGSSGHSRLWGLVDKGEEQRGPGEAMWGVRHGAW